MERWVAIGLVTAGLIILILAAGGLLDDPPDFPNHEDYYE